MKKNIALVSLALATTMVFTACQKDDNNNGLVSLNAEISNYIGNSNTKMYVDASRYTHWTSGDNVNINGISNSNTCPVDLSGSKAKITGVPTSAQGYLAVYPAGIASTYSAFSSAISVTLPSTQTYTVDGSGNQIIQAPMYAYCANGDNTLEFKNLCSLVKVTVNNNRSEDITMQGITITSSSSSSKLSGYASIKDVKTESPYLQMGSGSTAFNYVTLDFTSASETVSQGTSKSYYIVVPPLTSTTNITVTVEAINATKFMDKSVTQNSATLSANVIAQGPTVNMNLAATDFDGFGTESSPFQIKSSADLVTLRTRVNAGKTYNGKHFILINNIPSLDSWTGIGSTSSYLFSGTLDGNNKTITYSVTSTSSYNGLFKHIGAATVKNLNVDCTINNAGASSYSGYCGGIAGYSHATTYQNCTATGTITGSGKYYGGITGRDGTSTAVTISGCTSSVDITSTVSGDAYLGGIVGDIEKASSRVENCTASGDISDASGSRIGGIVGSMGMATNSIYNCTFTGTVTGGDNTNPIVGYKGSGSVTSCTPSDQND